MKLKKIKIGTVTLKNNAILAPMAGYTDFAFRSLCSRLGASLCFTEMVSAKGLAYKNENTAELLRLGDEQIRAVQLFGSDPKVMRSACESRYLEPFSVVDINMGCPVAKIYNNGEGSALMNDFALASKIISACVKSGKTVTVKFRAGICENKLIAADFATMCEQAGASAITIHGRTREGLYSGKVHYDEIARAKAAVSVPVFANGGVFCAEDADKIMSETGADGVAVARGAVDNPLIFEELTNISDNRIKSVLDAMFFLIDERLRFFTDEEVARGMRKTAAQVLKGKRGAKEAKLNAFCAKTTAELKEILSSFFAND